MNDDVDEYLKLSRETQDENKKRIAKDRIRDLLRFRQEFFDKAKELVDENGVIDSEEDLLIFRNLEYKYMKIIFMTLEENESYIRYLIDNE